MGGPAHVPVTSASASLTVEGVCPAMKISQEHLREPGLIVIDITAANEATRPPGGGCARRTVAS